MQIRLRLSETEFSLSFSQKSTEFRNVHVSPVRARNHRLRSRAW